MTVAPVLLLAASPALAQEPVPGDSVAAPAAPDTTPGLDGAPPVNVIGDTLPTTGRAPGRAAGDTTAAGPDTTERTADMDTTESLERVRADLEAARTRLREVEETLETIPAEDRPRRSPRGAVIRAFALPGWGQFYTGHRFRGIMYGAAEVGFAALGFLEQQNVNEMKAEQTAARLDFVAEQQAANPDTVFTLEDSLALFEQFDRTEEGADLDADLESAQKQREDYFTYAIFSVLFAAVDAFVSAHLQAYDAPQPEMRRSRGAWELGVRVPLGGGSAPPNDRMELGWTP